MNYFLSRLKLNHVISGLIWLCFSAISCRYLFHYIHDGDTWWHLANGRAILDSQRLIRMDIFSHTLNQSPWINFEWLSELLMALIVKHFGIEGIYWTKVILGATSLLLLIATIIQSKGRGPFLFLLTWMGYQILRARLCTRVEIVSLNFIPIFILAITYIRQSKSINRKWIPFAIGALTVAWCNAHGGFIYGLAFLTMACIGARLSKLDRASIALIDRSFVFSLTGSLFNPFGIKIYDVFIEVFVFFRVWPGYIAEWDPPTFHSAPLFWLSIAIGIVWLVRCIFLRQTSVLFWAPTFFLFSLMGILAGRNTAMFAFIILPIIAECANVSRFNQWISNKKILSLILWGFGFAFMYKEVRFFSLKSIPLVDLTTIPKGACGYITENNIHGTIYNSYGFGGYISWVLGPERKIFMDGRYIFYSLLVENQQIMFGKRGGFSEKIWKTYFDRYGIDVAITKYEPLRLLTNKSDLFPHQSVMNIMFPNKDWALVYWDDTSLVFLRRKEIFKSIIAKHQYKHLRPYDIPDMANKINQKTLSLELVNNELIHHEKNVGPTQHGFQIRELLANYRH